jgi:oligopeptide transport system substrate-binding protein
MNDAARPRQVRAISTLLAAAAIGVSACGSGEPDTTRYELLDGFAETQVLHRGNMSEPETLDPHRAEGVPTANILRDLFEGLVTTAPDGRLVPGAAERWEVSEDGTVYTFFLRPEGRWSNGDPLTAEDFVYSLRRSADPATGSKYSQILYPILNAPQVVAGELPPEQLGVRARDRHTLEITLGAPTAYFAGLLTHATTYPVHRPSIESHGDRFSRPGNLVSNGAYLLADWAVQSHVTLVRNEQYRDAADVRIEEVTYYPIEDQSTEMNRYRAGELDWTYELPNRQFRWISEHLADELVVSPWIGAYYFGFNLTRPPFAGNPELREALSLAVDREVITGQVSGVGEIPAYSWVPPGVDNYTVQPLPYSEWTQEERNARARELYAEAGYGPDNPLEVELRYNTHENHRIISTAVAAMWRDVLGVRTSLLNEEFKVFLQNRRERQVTEVFRAGWIGDYNDANTFAEIMHSRHGMNDPGYTNPEYDRLLGLAANEIDVAQRQEYLEAAERLLLADHAIIPVYFYVTKRLVKPYVGGWEDNIMDFHPTRFLHIRNHRVIGR